MYGTAFPWGTELLGIAALVANGKELFGATAEGAIGTLLLRIGIGLSGIAAFGAIGNELFGATAARAIGTLLFGTPAAVPIGTLS